MGDVKVYWYYVTCEDKIVSRKVRINNLSCDCGNEWTELGRYRDNIDPNFVYRQMQKEIDSLDVNTYEEFIYFVIKELDKKEVLINC